MGEWTVTPWQSALRIGRDRPPPPARAGAGLLQPLAGYPGGEGKPGPGIGPAGRADDATGHSA
jgi:hypothetical protein